MQDESIEWARLAVDVCDALGYQWAVCQLIKSTEFRADAVPLEDAKRAVEVLIGQAEDLKAEAGEEAQAQAQAKAGVRETDDPAWCEGT